MIKVGPHDGVGQALAVRRMAEDRVRDRKDIRESAAVLPGDDVAFGGEGHRLVQGDGWLVGHVGRVGFAQAAGLASRIAS